MSTVIYYFSGTGNSLIVAKDLAAKLNGELVPIPSVVDNDNIITNAETIGIVFPVYNAVFHGMPLMVKRFINKLEKIDSKYIFAVCTCLGWSYITLKIVGDMIRARGGKLSAGFNVIMPDNSTPVTINKQQKLFRNWKKKLEIILRYINARKSGKFEIPVLNNLLIIPFKSGGEKKTIEVYSKLASSANLTYDELVPLSDASFLVNDQCNGCGICARICPAKDIVMIDDKPVWQHHCESCLACINWCPKGAIHGGIVSIDKVPTGYHHPDVKLTDMYLRN
jgi:ferredoxin